MNEDYTAHPDYDELLRVIGDRSLEEIQAALFRAKMRKILLEESVSKFSPPPRMAKNPESNA